MPRAVASGTPAKTAGKRKKQSRNFVYTQPVMLRFLTAGESHGRALTVIVDGLPAGLGVTEDAIATELARDGVARA